MNSSILGKDGTGVPTGKVGRVAPGGTVGVVAGGCGIIRGAGVNLVLEPSFSLVVSLLPRTVDTVLLDLTSVAGSVVTTVSVHTVVSATVFC